MPLPPRAYLDRTAADQADLDTLAPRVPDAVRERIEKSDTDLDVDLADWYDDTTTRPRVSVLGPIQVRAQGELPAGRPRLAWHTEVVTYLATRPRGATVEAFGTALWPDDPDIVERPKLRNSIYVARKWLGVDPTTGQEYLPSTTRTGGGTYRIVGGLLDAELFRRLRLRGVTRGANGIPDLRAALDLVTGPPFDRQRPGGYGWLVDPALDHEYLAADRRRRAPARHPPPRRRRTSTRRRPRRRSRCRPAAAPTPCCSTWSRPATPWATPPRPTPTRSGSWPTTTPRSKRTYRRGPPRSCAAAAGCLPAA